MCPLVALVGIILLFVFLFGAGVATRKYWPSGISSHPQTFPCPDCGQDIRRFTQVCPHCGTRIG